MITKPKLIINTVDVIDNKLIIGASKADVYFFNKISFINYTSIEIHNFKIHTKND